MKQLRLDEVPYARPRHDASTSMSIVHSTNFLSKSIDEDKDAIISSLKNTVESLSEELSSTTSDRDRLQDLSNQLQVQVQKSKIHKDLEKTNLSVGKCADPTFVIFGKPHYSNRSSSMKQSRQVCSLKVHFCGHNFHKSLVHTFLLLHYF